MNEDEFRRDMVGAPPSDLWRHLERKRISTGYEGPGIDASEETAVVWEVAEAERFATQEGRVAVSVIRNGEPTGLIYVRDNSELRWWMDLLGGRNVQMKGLR